MCKFYSAVITKSGDLYHNTLLTSHEDIISLYGLNDKKEGLLVRVEFYPDDIKDICFVEKYVLHIDENIIPDWFEEYRERITNDLTIIIRNIIITKDTDIIVGVGCILSDSANIRKIKNSIVYYAGSSTIVNAGSSTIVNAGSSTIVNAGSSTIKYADNSTIVNADNSTIVNAGYSTIVNAGNSTIVNADNSTIVNAGYSTIKYAMNCKIINK